MATRLLPLAVTGLLITAAVAGLAGIDLVLPAVPRLPELFGTTSTVSQFVIAAYVAGNVCGLLVFGALASRIAPFTLLASTLAIYTVTSLLAAMAPDIYSLLAIRAAQGFAAIAPAVLAPGIIRSLFSETGALRVIGLMGSVESLSPALAPVIGSALLVWGWNTSFFATAVIAGVLTLAALPLAVKGGVTPLRADKAGGKVGYIDLITHPAFLRFAGTQSFLLGGLLVFVFSAPTVIVRSMGGTLWDFNLMQIVGVTSFIIATNSATSLATRFGKERMLRLGLILGLLGTGSMAAYGWIGGSNPSLLIFLFMPLNIGLGLAGPISFLSALQNGLGDDARASALIFLMITITSSSLTGLAALVIDKGLKGPATAALLSVLVSASCLFGLARFARLDQPQNTALEEG